MKVTTINNSLADAQRNNQLKAQNLKKLNNTQFGCIIFVILICIIIAFLLYNVNEIMHDSAKNDVLPGLNENYAKRNCDNELIYAVEDSQCENICKGPSLFRVQNGVCVNSLVFNTIDVENHCDPKKGVLAYVLGDPQFGKVKLLCLSVDPGIQPNNALEENIICTNGTMIPSINYVESFPQLSKCSCKADDILVTIESTSTIRPHGVCVSKQLKNVYEFNNLLFSSASKYV